MIGKLWGGLNIWWKLAAIGAVLAIVASAVGIYGHVQYSKGIAACQQQLAEQEATYQKNKVKQTQKKANETLKQETDLSKQLGKLQSDKEKAIDETRSKADYPDTCNLSPELLRDFQEAVRG